MEIENTGIQNQLPEIKEEKESPGTIIAAIALIVNAIFVLIELFVFPDTSGIRNIGSLVVDIILGIMLLMNKENTKTWVLVRAGLGLIIFSIMHAVNQNYILVVIQVVFSLSIIGLLIGKPKIMRITVCSLLIGSYFLLEADAILQQTAGVSILQEYIAGFSYQFDNETSETCAGLDYYYFLTLPHNKWKIRKNEEVKKENEVIDRWLILPGKDAHVIIIGEDFDVTSGMTLEDYKTAVLSIAEQGLNDFEIIEEKEIEVNSLPGYQLRTRGEMSGMNIEYLYALFINGHQAFQVVCFTRQSTMPKVEEDFFRIMYSFRLKDEID